MRKTIHTTNHNVTVSGIDDFNLHDDGDLYLKNETHGTVGYYPARVLEGWVDADRVVAR